MSDKIPPIKTSKDSNALPKERIGMLLTRLLSKRFSIAFAAALSSLFVTAPAVLAQPGMQVDPTFASFIKDEQYDAATMYIKGGYVTAETQDVSQIFFTVFMERYSTNIQSHLPKIDNLYTYLSSLAPINFNRSFKCGARQEASCNLAANLMSGANRDTIEYFIERGLDLNFKTDGNVPALVPLLIRLGTNYTLEDLNHFVAKGLSLGGDLYPISTLSTYRDTGLSQYRHGYQQLNIPLSIISSSSLNLLDLLIVVLGSPTDQDSGMETRHQRLLCEFVAYAAPSFQPSFDYLRYLLEARDNFRPGEIGKLERDRHVGVYEKFPQPCVTLLTSMIASHGDVHSIIKLFVAKPDLETANWLMTVRAAQP